MDPKFIPSKIVECAPVGPLSRYIEPYVRLIREQGYTPASVHEHVRVIVMFSQYLQRSACEIRDLDEAVVERFLSHELKDRYPHVWAPATLRRLLAMLRQMGATRGKPTAPRNPAQELTDDYCRFLLVERSLSVATAKGWLPFIDNFLFERFGAGPLELSKLRATDVTAFVQRHAHRHSPSQAKRLVTALRSFFRYLRYKGLIVADLDTTVPKVARWALSSLPKHIPAVEVRRVLDCCDQTTSTGRRNYAILLLLARLGLRAGEVVGLNLEDIDWENARISIRGKRIEAGLRKFGLTAFLVQPGHADHNGESGACRTNSIDQPLGTLPCSNRFAITQPFLIQMRGTSPSHINGSGRDLNQPLGCVTAKGRHFGLIEPVLLHPEPINPISEPLPTTGPAEPIALVQPYLIHLNHHGGDRVRSIDRPLPTICGNRGEMGMCEPFLLKYYGTAVTASVDAPLDSVTTHDRFGLVRPLITSNGQQYELDIRFRMLQPHELALAQGFLPAYRFAGTKTQIVRQIGNAVPRRLARAIMAAALTQDPDAPQALLAWESQRTTTTNQEQIKAA